MSGSGYVWYLTVGGQLTLLAGTGATIDFPPAGYDPTVSQPAMSLVLEAAQGIDEAGSGSLYYVTYHAGAVYFRGHGPGTAALIERIACAAP